MYRETSDAEINVDMQREGQQEQLKGRENERNRVEGETELDESPAREGGLNGQHDKRRGCGLMLWTKEAG